MARQQMIRLDGKGPANFVTLADKRAEEMLYTDLAKARHRTRSKR